MTNVFRRSIKWWYNWDGICKTLDSCTESGVSGLPTDEFILGDISLGTPSVASSDENYDDNLLFSSLVSTMTLPISICFPQLSVGWLF